MAAKYFGKYTGIVKANSGGENPGEIQVAIPSIFPADERVVARPSLPFGIYFVPENEAKVWIEFEGGETGLAVWTGLQYIAGEWAEEAEADPPTKRVIKTRAGHLLIFDDSEGEEAIQLKDGINGHVILLDKNGISITTDKELVVKAKSISLQADSTLSIKAADVAIEATGQLTLKGNPIHLNP
jgi:hypothetical protein